MPCIGQNGESLGCMTEREGSKKVSRIIPLTHLNIDSSYGKSSKHRFIIK